MKTVAIYSDRLQGRSQLANRHNPFMDASKAEIAATAARMVVEEGQEWGAAKRRAAKQMGLPQRAALPDNDTLERAIEEHISLFCADTQPQELRALRELALVWMERLQPFTPYIAGAVWHGTATRHSDIYLQLFCEDSKAAELALIDQGVHYVPGSVAGWKGDMVDALSVQVRSAALQGYVVVHLLIYDRDDLRGALRPDARGRAPRGDMAALRALLHDVGP